MPGEFLNTYHFVPILDGGPTFGPTHSIASIRTALKETKAGHGEWGDWSHGAWTQGRLSGRITCTLTTEDPVVIGGRQQEGTDADPCTVVEPCLIDGKPGIPPTTLKGMLSALVEAATNSATRVLDDRALSVRQAMGNGLSAIGMVTRRSGTHADPAEGWDLIPLTLPTLSQRYPAGHTPPPFPIPMGFRRLMNKGWTPRHRVFVGTRTHGHGDADFRFMQRTGSYSTEHPAVYRLAVHDLGIDSIRGECPHDPAKGRIKERQTRESTSAFLIAQRAVDPSKRPVPEDSLSDPERHGMTRGVLRVMHHDRRESDMPGPRKHELFIPIPEDLDTAVRVPVRPEAVRLFYALADERTLTQPGAKDMHPDAAHPFHPVGTRRNGGGEDPPNALRLKDGDLVFFDLTDQDDPQVSVLSFSSIWRDSHGSLYDYVPESAWPLHEKRDALSPAEVMFGVVEVLRNGTADREQDVVALKGRVRCSPAVCAQGDEAFMMGAPGERLKILASPKPPSPALYFRPAGQDRFVSKAQLCPNRHRARGRKMYLHPAAEPLGETALDRARSHVPAQVENGEQKPDKADNQRNRVRPIKPDVSFAFHVDFDDLPGEALDLLLFACRPTPHFRHRIGMGKALGLGRVRIDVTRVDLVDRLRRYKDDDDPFTGSRYHRTWPAQPGADTTDPDAAKAAANGVDRPVVPGEAGDDDLDPARAAARVVGQMHPTVRAHLLGIGEPRHIGDRPVHAPLTGDQQQAFLHNSPDAEKDTYRWFVAVYNEKHPGPGNWLADICPGPAGGADDDPGAGIVVPSMRTEVVPGGPGHGPGGGHRGPDDPGGHRRHGHGLAPVMAAPPRRRARPGAPPPGEEATGSMRFYDPAKGFGYMIPDAGGPDVRVEAAVVETCGMGSLRKGERVAVVIAPQRDRRMAAFVRRLKT